MSMEKQSVFQMAFDFFEDKPVVAEPSEAHLTNDAGLLVIRQFDERIELTQRFAETLSDFRHPSYVHHSVLQMVRSRVYGILADYEDQNDHDLLRSDPVFKLIAGRSPDADDLASQPSLSRFENAFDIKSLWRPQDTPIDPFLEAYADRGESENRNKELKCDLHAGRLSDHRYVANLFRLYLHAAASSQ